EAAGGRVERRVLFRASSMQILGGVINGHLGVAARIAALRRSSPDVSPQVSILLAFINLATIGRGGSVRRAKLLLAVSSVNIVYTIAYVGRDGLVFWLFTFVFLYLMFRDYLPRREMSWVKRIARLIVIPAIIGFSLITISRFSDKDDSSLAEQGSVLEWLFVYAGSQIFNFSEQYVLNAAPTGGVVYFNEVLKLTGKAAGSDAPPPRDDWWGDYTSYGVEPWRFQTFIGSFVIDFSRMGALILTVALAAFTRLSLRRQARSGVFSFSAMLCFLMLSQVVLFGVFYYRQFSTFYTQVGTLLIAFVFKLFRSRSRTVTIEKSTETEIWPPPWIPGRNEEIRVA
ncbi:MAG TPA: O-antigen polymerase, partial [Gemmatimonadaceae bacterium]|nr:O-antigen polymerase [Gemmatimonadaceae bacterium]